MSRKSESANFASATDVAAVQPSADAQDWLIWQLIDSAFPIGGFAHSGGLEAAWQHAEVRNRAELVSFVEGSLYQLGHGSLPLMTATHESPERLEEIDRFCDALLINHVANRASRAQGRAFLCATQRVFSATTSLDREPPYAHFAPVFGAVTARLVPSRPRAIRMFLFNHLRGLMSAAVRLNIIGPMEAQTLQQRLALDAEAIAVKCGELTLDELAQTSPLLDLWQGTQDRLYSRLFQS